MEFTLLVVVCLFNYSFSSSDDIAASSARGKKLYRWLTYVLLLLLLVVGSRAKFSALLRTMFEEFRAWEMED